MPPLRTRSTRLAAFVSAGTARGGGASTFQLRPPIRPESPEAPVRASSPAAASRARSGRSLPLSMSAGAMSAASARSATALRAPTWSRSSWVRTSSAMRFTPKRSRQAVSLSGSSPVSTSTVCSGVAGSRSSSASPWPTSQATMRQSAGMPAADTSGAIATGPRRTPNAPHASAAAMIRVGSARRCDPRHGALAVLRSRAESAIRLVTSSQAPSSASSTAASSSAPPQPPGHAHRAAGS